ncbi:unnamed protein product [Rotaria magnacalcarata]|uniref:Ras GTPase-activating protein-binding protein 1 n=2 Tax=Rotaria magnacalcarata TaxID=392030 RepID=A0A815XIQ3_9BILA|nr:unnamed protein product [Rotaria magnacalcarata]
MVQTSPSPFDVGRAFVHQYYTLLHQAPELLHRFYSTDSTFIHGGVDRPGSIEHTAIGPEAIARRINDLNLRDCHAKIRQVDSHPTIGNGVVVQVTGELSNNGDPMRRFMQTFVLAPRQPKKFYVQNDIFRYQDEVFEDVSDEDDRSSSQNYGDTDKVSNADSSAANTQQPSLVAASIRDIPEELPPSLPVVVQQQQQQQPLPPRVVNNQPQVIADQLVQQQETSLNSTNETTGYNRPQEIAQENQQQTKPISTEGASYAGIAKLNAPTGSTSIVNSTGSLSMPAPQATSVNRSAAVKSAPTRTNNQQRGNGNYYSQNNRNNQWNTNHQQDPSPGRRPGSNMTNVPNELQVFVGSLPADFSCDDLFHCFSQFGNVSNVKIQTPMHDKKKSSFGFVSFDDPEIVTRVVDLQHVIYNNIRLNVEPKTQKSYQGNANNGPQGNPRNNNYAVRGGNRGGNRGGYRGNANNPRRGGGGQHPINSPSMTGHDENAKAPKQQQQQ